jgi:hypothetical protein
MMPRPNLPKAEEVASIARLLRAEGFNSICIETTPDGRVSIKTGDFQENANVTPLEKWRAERGTS